MTVGKITIESGDYKAFFNFVDEKCTINFEPSIECNATEKTQEQIFVENTAGLLIKYLTYQDIYKD